MRPALRALVAGGLGFAVSLIAACGGGSHVLSADQASALSAQLDSLQRDVNAGDCAGVQSSLSQLSTEIANVPNATARANLTEGFDTLQSQAAADCRASTPQTTPTTKAPKTTTTTTHTNTQTTTTGTTQTQTTPTTPPATTTPAPGTTTSPGPGSGGAGFGPGNSGNAPGHNGNSNGNGH
jgi:hypothetical protein